MVSGTSNTAYSSSTPASSCASASQSRTCTNGALSGSFTATSCSNGCTGTPWGSVASGYSNTAYSSSSPAAACSTVSQARTCTNGTMSGTYTLSSCNEPCSLPGWGETIINGASVTAYSSPFYCPGYVGAQQETRTCTNGTLSGSYVYPNCGGVWVLDNTRQDGPLIGSGCPWHNKSFSHVAHGGPLLVAGASCPVAGGWGSNYFLISGPDNCVTGSYYTIDAYQCRR
jgi:hypothetical protein